MKAKIPGKYESEPKVCLSDEDDAKFAIINLLIAQSQLEKLPIRTEF